MKSKILQSLIFLAISLYTPLSQALSEDLYTYIFPSEESLKQFDAYFPFILDKKIVQENTLIFRYKADDLDLNSKEALLFQISVEYFDNENQAEKYFKEISETESREPFFQYGNKKEKSDPLAWIDSPNRSFHGVFLNRNRIFQYSIFQKDIIFNAKNYESFKQILDDNESIATWFETIHLNILKKDAIFNQLEGDFYATKESSSQEVLWDDFSAHQSVSFDLSVDISSLNNGTIIDSSGSQQSRVGDYYLYLREGKKLELAIYAPEINSSCKDLSGWHRLYHSKELQEYEWNPVKINLGIGGLTMAVNGISETCDVSQGAGSYPFYLGDYPFDPQNQSAVFVLKNFERKASKTSNALLWEKYLDKKKIPENLAWNHPYYEALIDLFQSFDEKELQIQKPLTRIEFIEYLYKNYHVNPDVLHVELPFKDAPTDIKEYRWLQTAYRDQIVEKQEFFRPHAFINHAEAFTLLARFRQYKNTQPLHFIDVPEKVWYLSGASYASLRKLIEGELFLADKLLTQEELANIFFKLNH